MKELISIEEKKVSALVVVLLATLFFALYLYLTKGDIPTTLADIIKAAIYATAGVSVANTGFSTWSNNYNNSSYSDTTDIPTTDENPL